MNLAPVAIIAYNRPVHLSMTLDALRRNELSSATELFIYCDAAKSSEGESLAKEVREVARQATGFASCTVIERDKNIGLVNNITSSATELVNKYGKVIVVEDDLITSPFFLRYMNDGLNTYEHDKEVASIHGWFVPHTKRNVPETFFLKGGDCLGWGTWKRAWDFFEFNAPKLMSELESKNLCAAFDRHPACEMTKLLQYCIDKKVQSWAICWHAGLFLRDMYTLYPGHSLVHHIGDDGSGTHFKEKEKTKRRPFLKTPVTVTRMPITEHTAMADLLIQDAVQRRKERRRRKRKPIAKKISDGFLRIFRRLF